MMKKLLIFVLASFISAGAVGAKKDGFQIKVKVEGLKDTTLLLGYYYGDKKYVLDTTRVDSKGMGVFEADTLLKGGIYIVVLPGMNYFEVLVSGNQQFSVETQKDDMLDAMKFTGSKENEAFLKFQKFKRDMQVKSAAIQNNAKSTQNKDSLQIFQNQLMAIDSVGKAEFNKIIANNPNTFLANILRAIMPAEQPNISIPEGTPKRDSLLWVKSYQYGKNHFWDNINFSDDRLLRTPIIENKMNVFFTKILLQIPDSIDKAADSLLAKMKENSEFYQYTLSYLLNQFQISNIMGMDAVFVHLAKNYYLNGKAPWADKKLLGKIQELVDKTEPNLIGRIAPELIMENSDGSVSSLHHLNAAFTIMVFWEPDCGHCQKVIPEVWRLYQKYKSQNVDVFAVYTQYDKNKWIDYINKNKIFWTNVWDSEYNSNFRNLYNIYSTPTIYLLDKDKKIIAKRIGAESLDDLIGKLIDGTIKE